ncbi:monooxygenase 2 isoform X2 [Lolium perenne]|uniref:monooxygenase 2 isoform X2 n=1 Tax=Lolium perenne TaxID=4522 RepID=UPI0021F5B8D2|nr:monooxygenase 2-like isoform X2 [Lolium perenne]
MQQGESAAEAEHIIVVGAGPAGLAVSLGLYRKGIRSVVLESSPALRASGYAITTWRNAFRALDALGVGDKIRKLHLHIQGLRVFSSSTGEIAHELDFTAQENGGPHETCRVRRDLLLRAMEEELPPGTIRYSSKIVAIDHDVGSHTKVLHLADGSTLRAKVLIGCDGVNSVVARWLGLAKPSYSGRLATRGLARYPDGGHGFQPEFLQFIGQGFRFGFVPCDETDVYWFYTWCPSQNDKGVDESAATMKQYVLNSLRSSKVPAEAQEVVERSEVSDASAARLQFRSPLSLVFASISKGNVCVAGDALHPMTPDLGQGGCSALEDGVVLARCLGEAVVAESEAGTEEERIESALCKYAGLRRWRSICLVGTAYMVGFVQQSDGAIVSFLREKVLAGALARSLLRMADYDCGTL